MFDVDQYVKDVCKPGTIECCRYLMAGPKGWECAKLNPGSKNLLDNRVKAGTIRAVGDNCEGKVL